jgi:hypothetical protein
MDVEVDQEPVEKLRGVVAEITAAIRAIEAERSAT